MQKFVVAGRRRASHLLADIVDSHHLRAGKWMPVFFVRGTAAMVAPHPVDAGR